MEIEEIEIMTLAAGECMDNIMDSLNHYSPRKIHVLNIEKYSENSEKFKKRMEDKGYQVSIIRIGDNIWEDVLMKVGDMVCANSDMDKERERKFIVHTDTGDPMLRSVMTVAAFVNGIRALSYDGGKTQLLPLFKLKYQTPLTDKKMQILKILREDITCCKSFDELSQRTGMSLPLISYHINGNLKSEGLKSMGLVDVVERQGRMNVSMSTQGLLLLNGYLDQKDGDSGKSSKSNYMKGNVKEQQPC
ncbi:MAG: winged helix-turn-helix domain-containing protein [Candidatus Woesearchaeota archaeon]